MFQRELENGYTIRALESDAFGELWQAHAKTIFEEALPIFSYRDTLSAAELAKAERLREQLGSGYRLNLAVYRNDEFVGWSWGRQESSETYYMVNSAILPAHRGKGLYQALVSVVIEETTEQGFQRVYSRHIATNNAVIIPKLKVGFLITGFELSDQFGTLVHLSYLPNPLRRKVLDYRAGQCMPDDEIKARLRL